MLAGTDFRPRWELDKTGAREARGDVLMASFANAIHAADPFICNARSSCTHSSRPYFAASPSVCRLFRRIRGRRLCSPVPRVRDQRTYCWVRLVLCMRVVNTAGIMNDNVVIQNDVTTSFQKQFLSFLHGGNVIGRTKFTN